MTLFSLQSPAKEASPKQEYTIIASAATEAPRPSTQQEPSSMEHQEPHAPGAEQPTSAAQAEESAAPSAGLTTDGGNTPAEGRSLLSQALLDICALAHVWVRRCKPTYMQA